MIAPKWTLAMRAICPGIVTIALTACLAACAPPAPTGRTAAADVPAAANRDQAPYHYRNAANAWPRHRPTARRFYHRYEAQQARADTINPPFDAGE